MLNKGPYIAKTVRALDDILRRMEGHHQKGRSSLRKLRLAELFKSALETRKSVLASTAG
jgi:pyruvate kinase